jgi:hypothetical protein
MKRNALLFSLLALGFTAACAGSPAAEPTDELNRNVAELPTTITLAPGASVAVERANLVIRFDSITADSRCPTDVQCVHAGWATAALTVGQLSGIMSAQLLSLSTTPGQDTASSYGKPLKLVNVTPVPVSTTTIPKANYRIELMVGAPR